MATNGVSPDATQNFTLTVAAAAAPAITSPDNTTFTAGTAGTFTVMTTGVPTPAISETGTLPSGVTFVNNGDGTATLAGTPAAGTGGTFPFMITAANGVTPDATQNFTLTVNEAPTITSADNTTFIVGTAGTFTVTTTGFPKASLSETGALPSGVMFVSNGDGTATLSGTPAAGSGGTFALTITATNGVSPDAAQNFTLTVNEAPAITSANSTTFTVGTAGTFTVTTTGFPPAMLSETGALPAGVTFVSNGDGTATLAGTPAAGTGGTYALAITATNGVSPDATQNFTLTVDQAPAITSAASQSFAVSLANTFTVTTTGFPIATLSETGALPSGVTFVANSDGTATLAGTPAAGTEGTYPLTFMATNGVSPDATQNFTLTVAAAAAPAITSADNTTFTAGTAGTFTVMTTGVPTPAISETGTLPSGVTFVNNGDGTATLAGTPAAGTGGTYAITIGAANGVTPDATQNFTLTVNEAPTITSADNTTFTVGTAGTFTVTTTGFPKASLSETGALPSGVTFVSNGDGTATLAGTPDAGTGGTYALVITASNGTNPDATQNFTLTVDQAPAITSPASRSFAVGAANTFTITTTGFPTPMLSETGALPSGVTFVDNGDGTATLAGTPAAGSEGPYALTINAVNGVIPGASQNFMLTVAAAAAPTITSADNTTFTIGTAGTFTVTTTGVPTAAISETGTLPTGVTFVDNGDGTATLAGNPAAGTAGTYPLTITAANGNAPDATQNFTLTVNQAPAITSANSTTFTVGTAGTFTVTTTGVPTPTLSETGALPSGVTFVDNGDGTATLAGTPDAGTGGTYALMITATNGVTPDATQNFTLTVNQAPAITSSATRSFAVGIANTFTITTTGFPTATLSETGALPSGVTFVANSDGTATLAGTPAAGTEGTYPLTITATNGVSPDAMQNFTLTVAAASAPAITSADNTTFTTGTAGTFTVMTTGVPTPTISETGALPMGVTFVDNGDGTATLAGTPAAGTGGTFAIVITAANGVTPDATQNFTLTVDQAPAITSADNVSFAVGMANTFTVTSTGFPIATLSETGALPSGVTFVANSDGTATLAGTPAAGTEGTYPLSITATNGVSPDAMQNFTLTVAAATAPTITSADNTTFTVGTAGTFTVTTTGVPSPTLTEAGALPTGVTFVDNLDGTATLAGTPAAGTGGTFPIMITAANGVSPDAIQNFTLTVNEAPAITSPNNTTFKVGSAGTFAVTTTGFPKATLTETGALPSGVTFVSNGDGTATLSGTPAAGTGGTFPIVIAATNGVSPDVMQNFTLTVDQAPAITSASAATFTVGTAGTFTVTTTGFPAPTITESGALPTGVTFTDNGNGTATLAGTPGAGTGGTFALTFTAGNDVSPAAIQNFTLTVDQAPAITSASSTTFTTNTAGTFTVTTTGVPNAAITETGPLPTGVTFVDNGNGTATLSGTPAPGTNGVYPLMIMAANGVLPNATQTFTLTVNLGIPSVTGISPTGGPAAGGTSVTITGTNFTGATAVDFGATAATSFTVVNDTTVTATSPAGTGTVDVTVTTPAGTSVASPADHFTYTAAAPTVTSISPTSGPSSGGTLVTITGTGFTGATGVTFGTVAATNVIVASPTTITAMSPAGTGVVNVTVTTPGGTSPITAADQFTYTAVAPTVVSLVRFGFHEQPTSLVLTFSTALDATRAENVNNYQLLASTGQVIPIGSAVYDTANLTVTLFPTQLLNLQKVFQLTVNGMTPNGLTGATGLPLDGAGNGTPGTNYVKMFSGEILAGPAPATASAAPRKFAAALKKFQADEKRWAGHPKKLAAARKKFAAAQREFAAAERKLAAQLARIKGPSAAAVDHLAATGKLTAHTRAARLHG
jgi:hypothetical protein